VRTRGRPTAAFIAWASRLGFKASRWRRYPGLQCPSTTAGHLWARSAEEVADGQLVTGVRAGGDFGRDAWPERTSRGCGAWTDRQGPASACIRRRCGTAGRGARAHPALWPARRRVMATKLIQLALFEMENSKNCN
jgi:hypothetical protein